MKLGEKIVRRNILVSKVLEGQSTQGIITSYT